MLKLIKRRSSKIGAPPGTLIHIGEESDEKVIISIIDYDEVNYEEKDVALIEECFPFKETSTVTWINISGVHNVETVRKLGEYFQIHSLVLEDIVNTGQRPKMEDFDTYIYVVLKMLYIKENESEITSEQISLVLGRNFVISLQENEVDVFNLVRDRIRKSKGRIRKSGADYLLYALIDAIVDNYFVILENYAVKIEEMEDIIITDTTQDTFHNMQNIKREVLFLRSSVWPLRELVNNTLRGESELVRESTIIYLRDVYDHVIQVIDTIEAYKEMLSGLHDMYLSSISNRMNEVMKTLTIFASIFIPLTFFAGIYGMNFEYMPELGFRWSYPVLLIFMLSIGGTLVFFFKKKGWL